MSSTIETVEAAIIAQLQTISYLASDAGGTCRGVSDIKTFFDLTTLEPPSVIVVFDGERPKENMTIGVVTQETQMHWSLYLAASSFGVMSEGRLGEQGAYQMIDDVVNALEGFAIDFPGVIQTKLVYMGSARYHVGDTVVLYEARFRHQFLRQG